jgi:acetylornithine deacetylase/succinyl-diaminopimelate desuccinylase family protein
LSHCIRTKEGNLKQTFHSAARQVLADGSTGLTTGINREELVALAQSLIRIPSENPPGNEKPVAEFLARRLRKLDMQVQIEDVDEHPGRPNVPATWDTGHDGPTLLFNGHLDVVPAGEGWSVDPFGGEIRDGRLYGRGACDMKGPLAAVVTALEAVRRASASLRGKIVLAGVVGEEQDQSGTRQLVADGIQADYGIVAEPTRLAPVIAQKGQVFYDITTFGKAAHGSVPHLGVNAVVNMMPVIKGVLKLNERLKRKKHPLCGHPTVNLGVIKGGEIPNAVPDRCTISLDRRLIPGETFEEARAEIEGILAEIAKTDPEFRTEVVMPVTWKPTEIAEDEPIVVALRRQTEAVTGVNPGLEGWPATCDATLLVNDAGIPTCIFGPGDLFGQAHKPDESVEIGDLVRGAKIYALTILDLMGV